MATPAANDSIARFPVAVIFDFDGVIADSEPTHAEALAYACAQHGVPFEGPRFVGWGDADALQQAFADAGKRLDAAGLSAALCRKHDHYEHLTETGRVRAYPGVADVLAQLGQRDIPVAICSAAMRREIDQTLLHLDLGSARFRSIVACDDTPKTKPSPQPYELSVRRLGVMAHAVIAIEDSPRGVASAKGAGLFVIAVQHTTSAEKLSAADKIVPGMPQIGAFLQQVLETGKRP